MKQDQPVNGNPLRAVIWSAALVLLLLPGVAMQLTTEVNWTWSDFAVFGTLLLVVCGAYELGTRRSAGRTYRLALGIALAGVFLVTWANLAVGIIGSPDNSWNLVFYAVPMLGCVLAVVARFKPAGMVRALRTTAMLQAGVALIALAAGWYHALFMAVLLALLWLGSAQLFRKAAAA